MTLLLPAELSPREQTQKSPTRRAKRDFSVCSRIGLGPARRRPPRCICGTCRRAGGRTASTRPPRRPARATGRRCCSGRATPPTPSPSTRPRVAVGHGPLGAHLRAELVERAGAAGAGRGGRGRPALRGRTTGPWAGCCAARRCDHGVDAGRRVDVPLQQPRCAAGARPGRRGLLHPARVRKRQQPLVVGRGGRRGRLRLPRQDAAGLSGAAGIHRGIRGRGEPPAGPSAARCGVAARGDGRLRGVVSAARRAVAVGRPAVHRRIAARQHRRIGVGLQRVRQADRR